MLERGGKEELLFQVEDSKRDTMMGQGINGRFVRRSKGSFVF